jgi:hypothetical protein
MKDEKATTLTQNRRTETESNNIAATNITKLATNSTMSSNLPPDPFLAPNYDDKVDFIALANQDADFADVLSSVAGRFDWNNGEHVR